MNEFEHIYNIYKSLKTDPFWRAGLIDTEKGKHDGDRRLKIWGAGRMFVCGDAMSR